MATPFASLVAVWYSQGRPIWPHELRSTFLVSPKDMDLIQGPWHGRECNPCIEPYLHPKYGHTIHNVHWCSQLAPLCLILPECSLQGPPQRRHNSKVQPRLCQRRNHSESFRNPFCLTSGIYLKMRFLSRFYEPRLQAPSLECFHTHYTPHAKQGPILQIPFKGPMGNPL